MQRCFGCMKEFGEEYDVCPHCGYIVGTEAASKNHLAPGTVLQSRYILGKALGQGGFGITYIAWDNKIGRAVAIKEYMPNALASRMTGEKEISCYNEEARRKFELGLEKARKETHAFSRFGALESIVKVHDCIEENGTAYCVTELVRGNTLAEVIRDRGRLSFAGAMQIMTPVLRTLDELHAAGYIYESICPNNIFVCEDGGIRLVNYDCIHVIDNFVDYASLSLIITSGYSAPEQYIAANVKRGTFTDVYAVSAILYNLLTGERPPESVVRMRQGNDLPALSRSDAPVYAQNAIRCGMEPRSSERIQTIKELLLRLQNDAPKKRKGFGLRKSR